MFKKRINKTKRAASARGGFGFNRKGLPIMYEEIIVSKGETSSGLTLLRDSMFILNGGKATETTVSSGGSMFVSKGGKATKTTVGSGGSMIVSKGTVNTATIASSGYFVMSGGTINNLKLQNASGVVSSGGGTINDLTLSGSFIAFYSGTINRAEAVHGNLYVYSGGKLNSATFNGGNLSISSNCTANKITLENGACINVYRSGKASNVTLEGGASAYVDDGAVVTNLTLTGGDANPEGDSYTARLVNYGTVKGLKIGSGTSVGLSSGCTVTKLTWTPGDGVVNIGDVSLSFTSKYSGVYVGSGGMHVSQTKEFLSSSLARGESAYVMKGGYANANELKGGKMEVWSGGKAENIFIGNDGYNSSWVDVSSGGTMTSARVSGGFLNLEGGFVGDTVIGNDGELYVSGGSASGIRVEAGGMLRLYSCTATDVEWTPFVGELGIGDDAHVTFKTAITGIYAGNSDTLLYHTEETLQDWSVNQGSNTLFVMSGGSANNTAVLGSGGMYVFGGFASGTTIGGENGEGYGNMLLYDDAYASDTVIHSGGQYVYSGGLAVSTTVGSMGYMYIFNSGTAEDVMIEKGGSMYVFSGGTAAGIKIQALAALSVREGGHADVVSATGGYYRQGGYVYVSSGAVVSNLQLEYGAVLYVSSGGKIVNVQSSYGSLIRAEKGASVKKITAVKAESPDSDHDEKNGWADKKKKTINSYILNSDAFVINDEYWSVLPFDENPTTFDSYSAYVGYTDEADFLKVHLDEAAKLSFSVSATDESKFTVWKYDESTKKLKSLQATTLKLSEFSGGKSKSSSDTYYWAETAGLLLESGDYFLSMESTNAAKGGNAYYDVYFSERTFFDQGDIADDDGDILRKMLHSDDPAVRSEYEKYDVGTLDEPGSYIMDDWVGYGDGIDFRRFSLAHGAKLSFDVFSDDESKFTVWKYDEKKGKLVSVQATKLKENKSKLSKKSAAYQATTSELALGPGEYYFSMESTNAAKGASAYYSVNLNSHSDFKTYSRGDNSDDWTDLAENGAENSTMYGNAGELDIGSKLPENWVGFGDEFDYAEFSVGEDAKLSFAITADDSVKFTVFTLSETTKGWKQNVLATKTLKTKNGKKKTEFTAEFDVAAGGETRYFYSVQSLNANKAEAGVAYELSVNSFNGAKVVHLVIEKEIMTVADAAALDMPESGSAFAGCGLNMQDELAFGSYDADALADASVSVLAESAGKSAREGLLA